MATPTSSPWSFDLPPAAPHGITRGLARSAREARASLAAALFEECLRRIDKSDRFNRVQQWIEDEWNHRKIIADWQARVCQEQHPVNEQDIVDERTRDVLQQLTAALEESADFSFEVPDLDLPVASAKNPIASVTEHSHTPFETTSVFLYNIDVKSSLSLPLQSTRHHSRSRSAPLVSTLENRFNEQSGAPSPVFPSVYEHWLDILVEAIVASPPPRKDSLPLTWPLPTRLSSLAPKAVAVLGIDETLTAQHSDMSVQLRTGATEGLGTEHVAPTQTPQSTDARGLSHSLIFDMYHVEDGEDEDCYSFAPPRPHCVYESTGISHQDRTSTLSMSKLINREDSLETVKTEIQSVDKSVIAGCFGHRSKTSSTASSSFWSFRFPSTPTRVQFGGHSQIEKADTGLETGQTLIKSGTATDKKNKRHVRASASVPWFFHSDAQHTMKHESMSGCHRPIVSTTSLPMAVNATSRPQCLQDLDIKTAQSIAPWLEFESTWKAVNVKHSEGREIATSLVAQSRKVKDGQALQQQVRQEANDTLTSMKSGTSVLGKAVTELARKMSTPKQAPTDETTPHVSRGVRPISKNIKVVKPRRIANVECGVARAGIVSWRGQLVTT
ncbi:hypothetical protein OIO90_004822 [Microbotryomycetes sp. JL221]|nr:hypothetical protein OIO90_004822 [Microbotryomycetes sp. JL221]